MEAGVDLAMFYQVPSYRELGSQSGPRGLSFSMFFAMILADAGYGLVLAAGLALSGSGSGAADGACLSLDWAAPVRVYHLVYGALVGSYFGVTPPDGSLLSRFHVI